MSKPVIADYSYLDADGNEVGTNCEQVVHIEGNAIEGKICIDTNPGIKKGDGLILRFDPYQLMQAITEALIEHKAKK